MKCVTNYFLKTGFVIKGCFLYTKLDEHATLKQVNKYKLKFKSKPWITPAIQKSICVKKNLLKRFINSKDPQAKEIFHDQYKDYRNMLFILLKIGKQIVITNILKLI